MGSCHFGCEHLEYRPKIEKRHKRLPQRGGDELIFTTSLCILALVSFIYKTASPPLVDPFLSTIMFFFANSLRAKALISALLLCSVALSLQAPMMKFLTGKTKAKEVANHSSPSHFEEHFPISSDHEFDPNEVHGMEMTEEQIHDQLRSIDVNQSASDYEQSLRGLRQFLDKKDPNAATRAFHKSIKGHLRNRGKSPQYISEVMGFATDYLTYHNSQVRSEKRRKARETNPTTAVYHTKAEQALRKNQKIQTFSDNLRALGVVDVPQTAVEMEVKSRPMIQNYESNKVLNREMEAYMEAVGYGPDDIKLAKMERSLLNRKLRNDRASAILSAKTARAKALKKGKVSTTSDSDAPQGSTHQHYEQPQQPAYQQHEEHPNYELPPLPPSFDSYSSSGSFGHPHEYQDPYHGYHDSTHQQGYSDQYHHQQQGASDPYQQQGYYDHNQHNYGHPNQHQNYDYAQQHYYNNYPPQ